MACPCWLVILTCWPRIGFRKGAGVLPSFANETVVRVRPAWVTDARNNKKADYGPAAGRLTVEGCLVQPGASSELVDALGGSVAVSIRWSVYAPPGTEIAPTDAVELPNGRMYQVNGEPQAFTSPTGDVSHVVLLLTDWS